MTSWTDYQDDISDAISDSMDVDWSASVGARAVVAWLNENKPLIADTPRVTVPVEPTEAMMKAADAVDWNNEDERASVINMWQAMLSAAPAPEGGGVETALKIATDLHHAYEQLIYGLPKYLEAENLTDEENMIREAWITLDVTAHRIAALATREEAPDDHVSDARQMVEAPAEAVEVDEDWIRGLIGEAVCMAEDQEREDESDEEICRIAESVLNAIRPYLRAQPPAREEAPAEAGEIGAEYDAAAHCVTLAECPPGLFLWNGTLGFKSEYGAVEHVGISPHHQQWKVGNRADAYCADSGEYFWGGTSNHDDRAKLLVYPIAAETVAMVASHGPSALRSQPPAREDAQPVAYGADHQPWCQPGDQTHRAFRLRFEDPDMREMVWAGPDAEREALAAYNQYAPAWNVYLFSGHARHPAPDALRDAERYRFLRSRAPGPDSELPPEGLFIGQVPDNLILTEEDADDAIDQALVALQAGQKGGAA